jgi:hypothetical protein
MPGPGQVAVGRHLAVDAMVLSGRRPGGVEADSALELGDRPGPLAASSTSTDPAR